MLEIEIISV